MDSRGKKQQSFSVIRPGRKENTSRAVTARVKSTWRVISEYSVSHA